VLILSVETATLSGSVAVARDREVLGVVSGDPKVSHSNTLLADIDRLLANARINLADVDVFAVATGPGSFTGLRIGIATVKALSATLDRPSVGIPTLESVALAGGGSENSVALMPAGRGEVFTQLFFVSDDNAVKPLDEPAHVPPARLFERYGHLETITWCGEGAIVHRELIEQHASGKNWRIAPQDTNLAIHVAKLAFNKTQFDDAYSLRAIYVRPADAQLRT
jgi:tRNA threonylcarbamoyladenosine biosynthesis protein TsaB